MMAIKDLILDLINRVASLIYSDDVSTPEINYRDHNLETSQEYDLTLTAYALGWKEGLEAAIKYLDPVQQTGSTGKELTSLSLTPWPEHPEYGWKSGSGSEGKSKIDVIDDDSIKCSTCGEPATNAARDVVEVNDPFATVQTCQPASEFKFGCDEHPAQSNAITRDKLVSIADLLCNGPDLSLFEVPPNLHELDSGLPKLPSKPLDCQGLDLNSSTGKIDSFINPASSGSAPWTGADEANNDLNNFLGGHPV